MIFFLHTSDNIICIVALYKYVFIDWAAEKHRFNNNVLVNAESSVL